MKKIFYFIFLLLLLLACNSDLNAYKDQIGDTTFNPLYDNSDFKFCDSTAVLHKRSLIKYEGGDSVLERDLLARYNYHPSFAVFNGYFIIRFAVNCKNETDRFRAQILDLNFNTCTYPRDLEKEILRVFKSLDSWHHAIYNGNGYDGYTFRVIKILNGNIHFS